MEKEKKIIRVAVDGPSGAGKSTVAKEVSRKLGIEYIDTGAMYRAIGYGMLLEGITCEEKDRDALKAFLEKAAVDFKNGNVRLSGKDISGEIRTPAISKMASDCSAIDIVRAKLVREQREMGSRVSVIMDGRDIGTNVFPDAEYKFFLTASPEARAGRRLLDLEKEYESGKIPDKPIFETVLQDIEKRDYNDSHRKLNPLLRAEDAVLIDSTDLTFEEVISIFIKTLSGRHRKGIE